MSDNESAARGGSAATSEQTRDVQPGFQGRQVEVEYEVNGVCERCVVNLNPGETISPGEQLIAKLEDDGTVSLWRSGRVEQDD